MEGVEPVPMMIYTGEPEQPQDATPRMTDRQYRTVMRAFAKGMPMHEIARHAHVGVAALRDMIARYHIEN